MASGYILSFLAGCITSLSPCVLPALPLVIGSAFQAHRHGPLALSAGMIVSFTIIGVAAAASGTVLGLGPGSIRIVAAGMMIVVGLILIIPALGRRCADLLAPLARQTENMLQRSPLRGLAGQFVIGALLGAVWSPCSGPTLGAAIAFAAQAESRLRGALMLAIFGLGAALPLLFVAYGSQRLLVNYKNRFISSGTVIKQIFGAIILLIGVLIITGLDRTVEGSLLKVIPEWITDWTVAI